MPLALVLDTNCEIFEFGKLLLFLNHMSLVIESLTFLLFFLKEPIFAVLLLSIPAVIILLFLKAKECLSLNRGKAKNREMYRSEVHYVMFLCAGIVVKACNPEGFWVKVGCEHTHLAEMHVLPESCSKI